MRAQFGILVLVTLIAASAAVPTKPPVPASFTCNATLAASLSTSITNSLNEALLPNATNTITKGGSKPYWSFTTPHYCWDNVFGFGIVNVSILLPPMC